ncbi:App1 family protein [Erythrobacter litoralis]|uniref:Phosphatidate phosphatase APP1 catalytic domain-containing protein n=1 Tax=Erythrobacter litoralis (strain HTCC2594) TaxID=314225 RepID=Q2N6S4_ERYLH|nr:phosphatase domain-containing protein [Erythrobacter litoralis]ABC64617.1 hypothetical protein ELI_12625 [Erythrobacter litoralis HTCC2594]
MRVQPYFGHRSRERLRISARALASGKAGFDASGRWQAMRTMLAQFASREVEGLSVELELKHPGGDRLRHSATSDGEGYLDFNIRLPGEWALPAETSWEVVGLHWVNEEGEQCEEGFVLVPGTSAKLGVISDIDDTIIETGITGGFRSFMRNWRRVLAQMPNERVAVPGADAFYNAIGGGVTTPKGAIRPGMQIDAANRPFFYVSSSPWNLFAYLVAFKRERQIPLGPLALRDWGLNRETFGSSSHGSHKLAAIREILDLHTDMRFALIGDDSQGDVTAFGQIAEEYGRRIAAVFIRNTGDAHSTEEMAAIATMRAGGVPLWMGEEFDSAADFLSAAGLSYQGETAQIVRAKVAVGDDA